MASRLHNTRTRLAKLLSPKILMLFAGVFVFGAVIAYSTHGGLSAVPAAPELVPVAEPGTSSPIPTPIPSPFPSPSPSPSPTAAPLTFAQMNVMFGPCVNMPTLMYHHIEDLTKAKAEGHAFLAVSPDAFQRQMQYLKDTGYSVETMADLNAFFDAGSPLPKKSVLLTFDDGYDDFGSVAWPILQQFGFHATLFAPTGLLENPNYITWNTAKSFGSQVLVANHTWSHRSMGASQNTDTKEILTADTQLADHGLNQPKVFSYPYGIQSPTALKILLANNYTLAFTTQPGSVLCKQQRMNLPRRRIGNESLKGYGL